MLAYEAKGLLIGEGVAPEVKRGIEAVISEQPGILRLNELRSMHLGPEEVLLTVSVDFGSDLSADEVERTISEMEQTIKARYSEVRRVFIEAQNWRAHQADRLAAQTRRTAEGDAAHLAPPSQDVSVEDA